MQKTKLLLLTMLLALLPFALQAQTASITGAGTYTANGVEWQYCIYSDGEAAIVGETSGKDVLSGVLNLPASVEHEGTVYPVTGVNRAYYNGRSYLAFYEYRLLTGINFPPGITKIGQYAFGLCTGLTSVAILNPVAVTNSDGEAFVGCGIVSASLPEGITVIPRRFFNGCRSLTTVNIPGTVTKIGSEAFRECAALQSIALPNGLTEIEDGAFWSCGLTTVAIPGTVTTIGKGVFLNCRDLTTVTGYPATLTDVPETLFKGCENLTDINAMPLSSLTTVGKKAFYGCRSLPGLLPLPSTLTSIGEQAYVGCTASMVGPLIIPNSVTSIGVEAFSGLTGLTGNLHLENITINNGAFSGCTGLGGTLTVKNCAFGGTSQFSGTQFTHLDTDTATLQKINGYLFSRNNPTMTFDESLLSDMTSISDECLRDMPFLVGTINFSPNLTSIGKNAFRNCGLTGSAQSIPPTATIGKGAFALSPNITGDIVIPDNYFTYTYFPWGTFYEELPFNWSGITSIDLGNLPYFFAPEYHHNQTISYKLWFNRDVPSQRTPNLLWVDARRCTNVYLDGSNNETAWKFGRKPISYYDDERYLNFQGLNVNALVYLPTESTFQATGLPHADASFAERFDREDGQNFIMDGKCVYFEVRDSLPYRVPFAFTALEAQYDREFNVTDGKAVSTLYLPYPTDLPDGMRAYCLTKKGFDVNGDKAFIFLPVADGTRLEANKPYIVQITDGQPHRLPVMHNVEVPVSPGYEASGVMATDDTDWKFYGTTEKIENADAYARKAFYLNGNRWWQVQDGVENDYIAPFRCFISSPTGAAAARSFIMVLEEDSSVTGIRQLEGETEDAIRSGRHPFYSVDGRLMGRDYDALERGQIYIVNGKKFYKF